MYVGYILTALMCAVTVRYSIHGLIYYFHSKIPIPIPIPIQSLSRTP